MNNLQRLFLAVFACAIFINFDGTVSFFFATVLLFFSLSPTNWFSRKAMHQPSTSEMLSIDGLNVLTALFKLRCMEITTAYDTIRRHQKNVGKEGSWIASFMQDFVSGDDDSCLHLSDSDEKRKQHALDRFHTDYNFGCAPLDLYRDQIQDIKLALAFWDVGPDCMQRRLKGLRSFGIAVFHIDQLIKLYGQLGKGSFRALFCYDPRKSFKRTTLKKIQHLWGEIITTFKTRLVLDKVKQEKNNTTCELFEEIEALENLERLFDLAISEHNTKNRTTTLSDSETLLLSKLSSNPFRTLWW